MEIRHRPRTGAGLHRSPLSRTTLVLGGSAVLIAAALILTMTSSPPTESYTMTRSMSALTTTAGAGKMPSRYYTSGPPIQVFYEEPEHATTLFRKFQEDLAAAAASGMIQPIALPSPSKTSSSSSSLPPDIVTNCGTPAVQRYQAFLNELPQPQPHLALEVLKYCALRQNQGKGMYLDSSSPLMDTLDHLLYGRDSDGSSKQQKYNLAVLNDPFVPNSIHSALLYLNPKHAKENQKLIETMLELLTTTQLETLVSNPTLIPKSLYDWIATSHSQENTRSGGQKLSPGKNSNSVSASSQKQNWYLLQHTCSIDSLGRRFVTAPVSAYALKSHR